MNWMDVVIIVILLFFTFIGWRAGLIRTVATIVGLGGGVYLGSRYYPSLGDRFSSVLNSDKQADIAAFIVILVLTFVVVHIAGTIVRKILSLMFLGWAEKLAGVVVGFLMGYLLSGAIVGFLGNNNFFGTNIQGAIKDSSMANFVVSTLPFLLDRLPEDFQGVKRFF